MSNWQVRGDVKQLIRKIFRKKQISPIDTPVNYAFKFKHEALISFGVICITMLGALLSWPHISVISCTVYAQSVQ